MLDHPPRSHREYLVPRDESELPSLNRSELAFVVHWCHLQMTGRDNESTWVRHLSGGRAAGLTRARCDSLAAVTNPHAGLPITDDDEKIAAALEDVSVPALMCSMVHLTGDPAWVRGELRPTGLFL